MRHNPIWGYFPWVTRSQGPEGESSSPKTATNMPFLLSSVGVKPNFSEDRKEPSADMMGLRGPHFPASRSATGKLDDIAGKIGATRRA